MNYYVSKDIAADLYKISGWEQYTVVDRNNVVIEVNYDLGFLLRKLPRLDESRTSWGNAHVYPVNKKEWAACYTNLSLEIMGSDEEKLQSFAHTVGARVADSPEDATAKLAIELFKKGVLKKESQL